MMEYEMLKPSSKTNTFIVRVLKRGFYDSGFYKKSM